jgi:hypothetical protein
MAMISSAALPRLRGTFMTLNGSSSFRVELDLKNTMQ